MDAERKQREADRARRDVQRAQKRLSKRVEVKAMKGHNGKQDQYVMRTEGGNDVLPPGLPSYNDVMDAASAPPLESPPYHETNAAPAMAFTSTATGYSEGAITSEGASTSNPVKAFLVGIGRDFCEEYYELFVNQGLDSMDLVQTLSDEELIQIGIHRLGHRKKILMALQ